jgi:stage V sporulation protein K
MKKTNQKKKIIKNEKIKMPIIINPKLSPINDCLIINNSKKYDLDLCKEKKYSNLKITTEKDFTNKIKELLDDLKIKKNNIEKESHIKEGIMNRKKKALTFFTEDLDKKSNLNNNNYNYSQNVNSKKDANKFLLNLNTEFMKRNLMDKNYSGLDYFNKSKSNFNDEEYLISRNIEDDIIITPKIKKSKIEIEADIQSLQDLINLCDKYPLENNIEYNVNMKGIHDIKPNLIELNNMIGVKKLKENIVDQLLYYLQDLHKIKYNNENDYLHTVIYGPPGTGKTEIAKIIGKIYSKIGILKKKTFKKATRADFIAGYLGQTTLKTKDLIKECLGGVLFIDEAYALGNSEKRDSFAKEAIDTLCESLSSHKHEIMVIIAGYEKELQDCFFSYNSGLQSRFPWSFKTDNYDSKELQAIFVKMINDSGWTLDKINNIDNWFDKNKEYFKFYGRDMENLLTKAKICHSRRIFGKKNEELTKITKEDLDKALEIFILHNDDNEKGKNNEIISNMYN